MPHLNLADLGNARRFSPDECSVQTACSNLSEMTERTVNDLESMQQQLKFHMNDIKNKQRDLNQLERQVSDAERAQYSHLWNKANTAFHFTPRNATASTRSNTVRSNNNDINALVYNMEKKLNEVIPMTRQQQKINEDLSALISKKNDEITNIQTNFNTKISDYRISVEKAENKITTLTQNLNSMQMNYTHAVEKFNGAAAQMKVKSNEIQTLQKELHRTKNDLKHAKKQILKYEEQIKSIESKISDAHKLTEKNLSFLKEEREKSRQALKNESAERIQIQKNFESTKSELNKTKELYIVSKSNVEALRKELEKNNDATQQSRKVWDNQKKNFQSKIDQLCNKVDTLQASNSDRQNEFTNRLTQLQSQHNRELQNQTETFQSDRESQNSRIQELLDEKQNLQVELKKLKLDFERAEDQKMRESCILDSTNATVKSLRTEIVSKTRQIEELTTQTNDLNAEVKNLKETKIRLNNKSSEKDEKIAHMQKTINHSQHELEINNERLSKAMSQLDEKEARISQIEMEVSQLHEQRTSQAELYNKDNNTYQSNISELEGKLKKVRAEMLNMKRKHKIYTEKSEAERKRLKSLVKTGHEEITNFSNVIKTMENVLQHKDTSINELQAKISRYQISVESSERKTTQMQCEIEGILKQKDDALETQKQFGEVKVAQLSRRVQNLEDELEGRDSQIRKLNCELAKLEGDEAFRLSEEKFNQLAYSETSQTFNIMHDNKLPSEKIENGSNSIDIDTNVQGQRDAARQTRESVSRALKRMSLLEKSLISRHSGEDSRSMSFLDMVENLRKCQRMLTTVVESQQKQLADGTDDLNCSSEWIEK